MSHATIHVIVQKILIQMVIQMNSIHKWHFKYAENTKIKDWTSKIFATLWSALSKFTKETTDREKLKLAFDFYDIDKDGFITREEMFEILKMVFFTEDDNQDKEEIKRDFRNNRIL